MMMRNNPALKKMSGNATNLMKGFRRTFKIPIMAPVIKKNTHPPVKLTLSRRAIVA